MKRIWIWSEIGDNRVCRLSNRLLLPYERYQRGEEEKIRLTHGRRSKSSSVSEESEDIKQETNDSYPSDTPPPVETSLTTASPPLQSIVSTAVRIVHNIHFIYHIILVCNLLFIYK